MLVAASVLLGLVQEAQSGVDSRVYLESFLSGVVALDAGQHDVATRMFELAGEAAPDAPVWRVHAAVAHARAGRAERARTFAAEALAAEYPLSDLAAIDPTLALPEDKRLSTGEATPNVSTEDSNTTSVAVALPPPVTRSDDELRIGQPRRIAHGPSRVAGPEVERVHVRDSDDAVLAWVDDRWRRFDLEGLDFAEPGGNDVLPHKRNWNRPRMQPPNTALRNRVFALVGKNGGDEEEPIVLTPKGDAWLVFQTASTFDNGTERDLLNVVNHAGATVVARLGMRTDLMGPVSLWPPYFSPNSSALAVSGWWGASIHVFDTHDWSLRWQVDPRVGKGTSGSCAFSIANDRRLYAVDSCLINTHLCEVYDLTSGAILFRGEDAGMLTIDGTGDDRYVVAQSVERPSALIVLDGADFSPLYEAWLSRGDDERLVTTILAADGTFDSIQPQPRDLVVVGRKSIGASQAELAPWLLDPLHVRSLVRDTDRAPRRVPLARLRVPQ